MSDFGDGAWVTGRKIHRCTACYAMIPRGERHYHYQGRYGGDWQNWRMHRECYDAYAADGYEEFLPGDFPVPDRIWVQYAAKSLSNTEQATQDRS